MINKKIILVIILNLIILATICFCERNSIYNTASTNIVPKNSCKSTLETKNIDSWIGDYFPSDSVNVRNYAIFDEVLIYKENNNYFAKINMFDCNRIVYYQLKAKVNGDNSSINFVFDKYIHDEQNTDKPYNKGDILFTLKKTNTGIIPYWGKIKLAYKINKENGICFTKREIGDGYIGNWYESLPDTGGNSSFVKIKEMTSTSVKFNLYFCRTAGFENISCKREGNIVRFTKNDGEDKTSGMIEFVNKSIIVNIVKSTIPILKPCKTIFKYKVNTFNAVKMSPYNGAANVDLSKGIVLTFDRRIHQTINNPSAILEKVNVPFGYDDDSVFLHVDLKGNKLIFTPDYDSMKDSNKAIEAWQKYELNIGEGEYRDDIGNIINDIKLQFTTK